jgi:hypothetical protein
MERHLDDANSEVAGRIETLRKDIRRECGSLSAWWTANILGPLMLWTTRREQRRLDRGVTYEPETFVERANWSVG